MTSPTSAREGEHQAVPHPPARSRDSKPDYRERLAPPTKFFAAAALTAPMVSLVLLQFAPAASLAIGVATAAGIVALMIASAPIIELREGWLFVGGARIETRYLGSIEALHGDEAKERRGPGHDPRGWVLLRGGIDGVLTVQVTDSNDPVSSWTISTRTPDRLAAVLERAQLMRHSPRKADHSPSSKQAGSGASQENSSDR